MCKQIKIIVISLVTMFIFTACSFNETDVGVEDILTLSETISTVSPMVTVMPVEQTEEPKDVKMFSDEEVQAITRTLAGECYDNKLEDKKKVVEVILNRVSNEKFEKTVLKVVSAKGQLAEETLERWYANDCEALSDYLFFYAGPNRENVFRVKY